MPTIKNWFLYGIFLGIFWVGCKPKPSREELYNQKMDSLKVEIKEVKQEKIDLILTYLHRKNLFNGQVLLVYEGQKLFEKSYGFADFRDSTAFNKESAFQIGAITKQFTAMAIMMLQERKKLKYKDKVKKYIKDFPYEDITVYQLLTHTSGLPDYISYFYINTEEMLTYANNKDVRAWIVNNRPELDFVPGKNWTYSNTGYVFLAEIVQSITHKSFASFLKKNIFDPLQMQHTFLRQYSRKTPAKNRVLGFYPNHQKLYDDNALNYVYGDKGIYSTAEDLYKWDSALYTDILVKKKTLQQAFQPVKLDTSLRYPYAFGWHIQEQGKKLYHMGGWLGFQTMLMRIPKDKSTIIILTNDMNPIMTGLTKMLYNIMYSQPYSVPR